MFKSILSFFWKTDACSDAPLSVDEAYNAVSECEDTSWNNKVKIEEGVIEDIDTYEICNKIGKITKICDDVYTIDDTYNFQSNLENLLVGTKISYHLIRSAGEVKVGDVHIVENDWNIVDIGKHNWHVRTLICTVLKKEGRVLTLTPGDITVNLNDVCSAFIPIVGDWIELAAKCLLNENVVDLSGKIIEINKLQPLRLQVKLGKISRWNSSGNTGLMDKNIFFNKDALYGGYFPVQGDRVVAEIIESNQGSCTWRALKVIPDYLHSKEHKEFNNFKEEDFKESHETLNITDNISLTFTRLGECKLFILEIESKEDIQLVCVELPKLNGQCRLLSNIDRYMLKSNRPLTITCECRAKNMGESREILIFHFERFKIRRWVTIQVASYPQNNVKVRENDMQKFIVPRTKREVIKGQKIKMSARFIPLCMPDFAVPERLYNLIVKYRKTNILKTEMEKMKPCLVTPLNYMNFEDKFHTLLHLDEIHMKLEMQNYDQERACFIRNGEFLLLEIENLAERRPSVIPGDRVFARNIFDEKSPEYEGIIHKTGKNHLHIKFSQIFHDSYDGEDYSVYIVASRVTYRRKHFAVHLAVRNLGCEWLFPTRVIEKKPQLEFVYDSYFDCLNSTGESEDSAVFENKPCHNIIGKKRLLEKIRKFQENGNEEIVPVRKLEWYNKSLNYYQKEAVRNVLLGVCRPLPYIIFGPPGTGKTVTLVETVLQILRLMPHSRILVSAPSNSAADLIALRLIDSGVLKPGDLIRLVAMTAVSSIPVRLAPYCATANIEKEGTETSLPVVTTNGLVMGYSSSVLGRHRITVCTCSSAGLLYCMGFAKGHFSHIIVDEAGQTSEPSLLIPLAFLDISSGQAVLAGDPMQLGPVVLSQLASEYGLEDSFLERMVNRFPYLRDADGFPKTCGYDPRLITKLIYNYRSLPDLLKLPSVLFYNDDLIPTISGSDSKEAALLEQLKDVLPKNKEGKISSIMFHCVVGENFQREDSPSWFNPSEASQVFSYVNELFRLGLTSNDIGVITPYKAQTKQLLDLFREAEFNIPKIGTVEEFQGQEYNVIIVSTVRSNKKYLAADKKYTIGFISSPRRLNVSITRAKALLIVIGNSNLLATDRCWRSVINYCIDKGSYVGTPIN
ncbi:helicase Mov10l1 [Asbolus verrucosus]|uniref:RNA helicase n=1 Tax=Asbolus verrucosus TaxID=1661398 RepID=A0A482VZT4_ASBVE|nr:helicase Mov10l1 [Asbolus verrucosus]